MISNPVEYKSIEGKTYSLFADTSSPDGYYKAIAAITLLFARI
jgi:hypothetical protein